LYTRDHNGGGVSGGEVYIIEQMQLYPNRTNVHNWNFQDVYRCHYNTTYSYPVHHIHEWDDPLARQLILAALGYQNDVNAACLPGFPGP
jgi:hypothetical protein